jgi:hypothetical protein
MSVAIVVLETLAIPYTYPSPVNQGYYGGEWGSPQVTSHLEVPEGLDPQCLMAVRDPETGAVTLQADPAKVQAKLDQAWTQLRTERNRRLAASDWTQLVDSHLSQEKKDAWAAYRQELRDLPDEVTDPTQVEWPLDPTQQVPVPPVTGSRLDGILGQV